MAIDRECALLFIHLQYRGIVLVIFYENGVVLFRQIIPPIGSLLRRPQHWAVHFANDRGACHRLIQYVLEWLHHFTLVKRLFFKVWNIFLTICQAFESPEPKVATCTQEFLLLVVRWSCELRFLSLQGLFSPDILDLILLNILGPLINYLCLRPHLVPD